MIKGMLLAWWVLLMAAPVWAQDCDNDRDVSTPTARFSTDGVTVTDNETQLSWMRCAVGQHWSGTRCMGEARVFDWRQAMDQVERINAQQLGGHSDWRMPLVPELASIVERHCFNPRMNTEVFAGAPAEIFWSAMEKMGMPDYAYTLDFGGGAARATAKDGVGAVRLVRGGPWWEPPAAMLQQR